MVYQILVAPESYTRVTSAFGEGLYFKGSWQKGQTIRFMTPGGDGVVSDIAENRPNEFISLRHFGYIVNGAEAIARGMSGRSRPIAAGLLRPVERTIVRAVAVSCSSGSQ